MAKEKVFTPTQVAVAKIAGKITQTGTNNPILNILQNTVKGSGPITALRTGTGTYVLTLSTPAMADQSKVITKIETKNASRKLVIVWATAYTVQIICYDQTTLTPIDTFSPETNFSIEIYDQINMNM